MSEIINNSDSFKMKLLLKTVNFRILNILFLSTAAFTVC